jgi:hypothetical protein
VDTTMIYTHVVRRGPLGVSSPVDRLHHCEPAPPASPPGPVVPTAPSPTASSAPRTPRSFRQWLRRAAVLLVTFTASGEWRA